MNKSWNYPRHSAHFQPGEDAEFVISASTLPDGRSIGLIAYRRVGDLDWTISDAVPSHENDTDKWRAFSAGCLEAIELAGKDSSIVLFIPEESLAKYLIRTRDEGSTTPPKTAGKKPRQVISHDILAKFLEMASVKNIKYNPIHIPRSDHNFVDIYARLKKVRDRKRQQLQGKG